jgi:cobalamin biosynthesis protein CobD/CbiB
MQQRHLYGIGDIQQYSPQHRVCCIRAHPVRLFGRLLRLLEEAQLKWAPRVLHMLDLRGVLLCQVIYHVSKAVPRTAINQKRR